MKKQIETLDLTPTWPEAMQALLLILESGNNEGKKHAKEEIMRCAEIAQRYVDQEKDAVKASRKLKRIFDLINRYEELKIQMREQYGGYASPIANEMDKIEREFIQLAHMTMEDYKKL